MSFSAHRASRPTMSQPKVSEPNDAVSSSNPDRYRGDATHLNDIQEAKKDETWTLQQVFKDFILLALSLRGIHFNFSIGLTHESRLDEQKEICLVCITVTLKDPP